MTNSPTLSERVATSTTTASWYQDLPRSIEQKWNATQLKATELQATTQKKVQDIKQLFQLLQMPQYLFFKFLMQMPVDNFQFSSGPSLQFKCDSLEVRACGDRFLLQTNEPLKLVFLKELAEQVWHHGLSKDWIPKSIRISVAAIGEKLSETDGALACAYESDSQGRTEIDTWITEQCGFEHIPSFINLLRQHQGAWRQPLSHAVDDMLRQFDLFVKIQQHISILTETPDQHHLNECMYGPPGTCTNNPAISCYCRNAHWSQLVKLADKPWALALVLLAHSHTQSTHVHQDVDF